MDITVEAAAEAVVAALRNAGYAESTIGQHRKSIKALRRFAEGQGGIYTKELGIDFSDFTVSPATGKFSAQRRFDYGRLVWSIDSYADTGTVDLSVRRKIKEDRFTSPEYSQICISRQAFMGQKGLARATREAYSRVARGYMGCLESLGVLTLGEAEGSSVYGFLGSLMATRSRTSPHRTPSNFRPFIKSTGKQKLIDAVNNIKAARPHKTVPVLCEDDEAAVIRACCNKPVSRRSAAIALPALATGMRACGTIDLRIGGIEWRSKCITVIQHKTNNPSTVPLLSSAGNAISGYLLEERPDSAYGHASIRTVAPFAPLADHASVYEVIRKVFVAASASKTACGTRLLRHDAATKMLEAGTAPPVIAAALGRATPDSANACLSVEGEMMRARILPLPKGART